MSSSIARLSPPRQWVSVFCAPLMASIFLSNELAHTYLNSKLTHEDRQRLTQIICGQQVNFVDVLTSNNTNLQISFVHSRYRNENVAICVLVDVSSRVKMEESLQEMAQSSGTGEPVKIDVSLPPSVASCERR